MLKLIGALLILAATTLIGFFLAHKLISRCNQLRDIQMSLQVLETEICYGSTPLEIAFQKLGAQASDQISLLFKRCSHYFQHLDGATTAECWQKALQETIPFLALKKAELEWLRHFGQIVGTSDRQDQQKHLQLMITHLAKIEAEAREEQQRHEKMYKTLGVLSGLVIVILMM